VEARHILIVEDDETNREGLRTLLELWGHQVEEAATGESGVQMAIARRPDVVLLDIGLPDLNGYEVAKRIRRAPGNDNVVLIALTGYGELDEQPADARFDTHVMKPVDCDRLRELMSTIPLGGRRAS
jgi:two-component system CheB/CheR fusion protein